MTNYAIIPIQSFQLLFSQSKLLDRYMYYHISQLVSVPLSGSIDILALFVTGGPRQEGFGDVSKPSTNGKYLSV